MTRWARVGNSQKHKKLPEDATPWGEFWQNRNQNSTDDANRNKVKSGRIEKRKLKQKKKFGFDKKGGGFENPESKSHSKFRNSEQEESKNNEISPEFSSPKEEKNKEHPATESRVLSKKQLRKEKKKNNLEFRNAEQDESENNETSALFSSPKEEKNEEHLATESRVLSKKQLRKEKKKNHLEFRNAEQDESENNETSALFSSPKEEKNEEHPATESRVLSKKQLRKEKKKAKLQQLKSTESHDVQDEGTSIVADSAEEVSRTDDKSPKEKDFQGKKKLFMQRLEKKRKENGILLLPAKVERKLYIIKRRLREKGLPAAVIKDIARKERRKEELKFRRSVSTKPCFNCRQTGHLLAECPMRLGNSSQETGLCFKCGSAEHTSYKCPEKIQGYPLAKCFVCKEQGHISKDCPQNDHGIYIKGGKCGLCGNINHLKKDCPTLRKNINEEEDIAAYTINEEKSVDAEIIPTDDVKSNAKVSTKKNKKVKLVKF